MVQVLNSPDCKSKIKVRKPIILGLSGGIASGKTTVAQMLASLGALVVDADQIAHQVLEQPTVRRQIARRWGHQIFRSDGTLDRHLLAQAVFADPSERRTLEKITHPRILRTIKNRIRQGKRAGVPVIVLDAPLLYETHLDRLCDVLVFVTANAEQRIRRATQERGWSRTELMQRQAQQLSLRQKRRWADVVIDNSGSLASTKRQVHALWRQITNSV